MSHQLLHRLEELPQRQLGLECVVPLHFLIIPLLPLVVDDRTGVGDGEPVHDVAGGPPLVQEVIELGLHEGALRVR